MPKAHEVKFNPNPVQKGFIESHAMADLFSSRMGEGKSTALSWSALYHTRHNPGARWILMRDTWANLQRTTQKTFFEWFPPQIMGTYHVQSKTYKWASGIAEGEVIFMGMDDPKDAASLMSMELGGLGMDEAAPAAGSAGIDELVFDIALSRPRMQGMKWTTIKVAENNPDESHWTHRRFVQNPHPEFKLWQPASPENLLHLPPDYYEKLRVAWAHRPDLIRRFIDGEFGFQAVGKAVTPQWQDKKHLTLGLKPIPGLQTIILWDFGHNPTAILTQKTPLGHWLILDALVGDEMGAEELIGDAVKPLLATRYPRTTLLHIGDPQGKEREQTSIHRSAVGFLKKELGGVWRDGPVKPMHRIPPLQAALHRGTIKVDRDRARAVWHALRGGWHYHITRTGVISGAPVKDLHSHPGDAMSYGAAILFPMRKFSTTPQGTGTQAAQPKWFNRGPLGFERPGLVVPAHGSVLNIPTGDTGD